MLSQKNICVYVPETSRALLVVGFLSNYFNLNDEEEITRRPVTTDEILFLVYRCHRRPWLNGSVCFSGSCHTATSSRVSRAGTVEYPDLVVIS